VGEEAAEEAAAEGVLEIQVEPGRSAAAEEEEEEEEPCRKSPSED
jgi:hypothetical protein